MSTREYEIERLTVEQLLDIVQNTPNEPDVLSDRISCEKMLCVDCIANLKQFGNSDFSCGLVYKNRPLLLEQYVVQITAKKLGKLFS